MPFLHGSRERNRCLRKLNCVLDRIIVDRWNQFKDNKKVATAATKNNYTSSPSSCSATNTNNASNDEAKNGKAKKSDILSLCMSQIDHMDSKVLL